MKQYILRFSGTFMKEATTIVKTGHFNYHMGVASGRNRCKKLFHHKAILQYSNRNIKCMAPCLLRLDSSHPSQSSIAQIDRERENSTK